MILLNPIYLSLLIFKSVLRPWIKEIRPLSTQSSSWGAVSNHPCSILPTVKTDTGSLMSLYQRQTKYFHLVNFVLIYSKLSLKGKRKIMG